MRSTWRYLAIIFLCIAPVMLAAIGCGSAAGTISPVIPSSPIITSPLPSVSPVSQPSWPVNGNYTYRIVAVYPHDTQAFTQGLVYNNGFLYEGTGLNGSSSLRKVELATGRVLQITRLPEQYFGEGIAVVKDRIIQLTWQSGTGFVYDKTGFNITGEFQYAGEGWGLAYDGRQLIMSNGTPVLQFLDPDTLGITGKVNVHYGSALVQNLNELEYVNGRIFANVWKSNRVAIIDPEMDGWVTGWIDLSGLLQTQGYQGAVDVLNGIAYDSAADRLFVTGKFWPYVFEVKLVEKA